MWQRAKGHDLLLLSQHRRPTWTWEPEQGAVAATGMKYFHIPYDGSADPVVAEQFLDAITSEGAEPSFVHCAEGV